MCKSNLSRIVAAAAAATAARDDAKAIQERTLGRLSRFPPHDPVQSARDYQAESLRRLARLAGRPSHGDRHA